jgi:hypothetical protein
MIARLRHVQKSPKCTQNGGLLLFLFFKQRSKLISPAHIVRMSLLQHHELLTGRGCVAPELCQEINNSALLGDPPFRDIHLPYSLHEFVHDSLSSHLPPAPPDSAEMVVELYGRTA